MNREDIDLLYEIQRNTEMAKIAIETLSDKVDDDNVSYQLEKQNLIYSNIHDHAVKQLVDANIRPRKSNILQEMMLRGEIHMNTLLNTSTNHIADLMLRGSARGISSLYHVMNKQKNIRYLPKMSRDSKVSFAMEVAQELAAFEESCMEKWRTFL